MGIARQFPHIFSYFNCHYVSCCNPKRLTLGSCDNCQKLLNLAIAVFLWQTSCTLRDLNSLNTLQGGLYSVSSMQQLTCWDCHPSSLLMHCIPCALLDHSTHDPQLDIPKQSLLLVNNTFQYQVQLLVPAGLFTHAIPYMILAYHFWHFCAHCLPLVSQVIGWVSTQPCLPLSGYYPELI